MNWFTKMLSNPYLLTALTSWLIAQVLKTIIHAIVTKKIDLFRLVGDGGMPSGHSATVSSLAMISALINGPTSFEFGVTLVFAIVVCHDAMGVRLETGKQAVILNELMESLGSLSNSLSKGKFSDIKLKEFVGHTPLQVMGGITTGILNAILMYNLLV